jgi:molybdopterin synthase catalytic subunit
MFSISSVPLDVNALGQELSSDSAGAYVAFEGRVRNHNKGRDVLRLEYEAHDALCQVEYDVIIKEIAQKFAVLELKCVHRVGQLPIGEVAVWGGVIAVHRREAFLACEYLITQLKKRLPIWKKEVYVDGSSVWVDEACGCG